MRKWWMAWLLILLAACSDRVDMPEGLSSPEELLEMLQHAHENQDMEAAKSLFLMGEHLSEEKLERHLKQVFHYPWRTARYVSNVDELLEVITPALKMSPSEATKILLEMLPQGIELAGSIRVGYGKSETKEWAVVHNDSYYIVARMPAGGYLLADYW